MANQQSTQWTWIQSSLPFIGMTTAIVALAINSITSKMAMSEGTSFYLLSVYSNGLATLILFPTAYFLHRSKWPPLSFPVMWRIFLLASFGYFAEIGSYAGINYSSPTLGTAMLNLVPAFTYVLAIIFRMEQVDWRRLSTVLKSIGTVVSISGAFIVTFYKGPSILNSSSTLDSFTKIYSSVPQNWILGGSLLCCAAFFTASWCILQASILKLYPYEMIVVAIYCIFLTIQSSLGTLIMERDLKSWRIGTNMGLVAILYAAIINIAYRLYITTWCLWRTGPFFVSLFKPLTVVVTIIIGVIFMKEVLYLGSLVGTLVLGLGFYAVIWGKAKEGKMMINGSESSSSVTPLLQDKIEEEV